MALMKFGGAFEKPNVMIVNSYRYTEIYESTKPQDNDASGEGKNFD